MLTVEDIFLVYAWQSHTTGTQQLKTHTCMHRIQNPTYLESHSHNIRILSATQPFIQVQSKRRFFTVDVERSHLHSGLAEGAVGACAHQSSIRHAGCMGKPNYRHLCMFQR
jgi:hypothetical protein